MTTTRRQAILGGAAFAAAAALPHLDASPQKAQAPKTGAARHALADAVSLSDFEAVAHQRMTHMAWEYVNSAAADEITLRWNREALDKIRLNPRVLRDVSQVDTKVKLLGQEWPFPFWRQTFYRPRSRLAGIHHTHGSAPTCAAFSKIPDLEDF